MDGSLLVAVFDPREKEAPAPSNVMIESFLTTTIDDRKYKNKLYDSCCCWLTARFYASSLDHGLRRRNRRAQEKDPCES